MSEPRTTELGQPPEWGWRRRLFATLSGAVALSACTSSTAPVSELDRLLSSPDLTIVAAGDSMAAGTGTSKWDTDECARGEGSPAELVAQAIDAHFKNIACAGRTIAGMSEAQNGEPSQLDQLAAMPGKTIVVFSGGANAVIDFQRMADHCSNSVNDCGPNSYLYQQIRASLDNPAFVDSLEATYLQILESGDHRLVVTEYPTMVQESLACAALARVLGVFGVKEGQLAKPSNAWLIAEVTRLLNKRLHEAVGELVKQRADLAPRITVAEAPDLALCGGSPKVSPYFVAWYQAGLSDRAIGHPNARGNDKIGQEIAAQIRWDNLIAA